MYGRFIAGPQPKQSANRYLVCHDSPIPVLPCEITLLCLDCAPIIQNENPFEKGDSFVKKIPSLSKREGIRILLYETDLFGHLKKHSCQQLHCVNDRLFFKSLVSNWCTVICLIGNCT